MTLLCTDRAWATDGPPGLYVVIDPYKQTSLASLNAAASAAETAIADGVTSCSSASGVEPFCSETNGVLLSVDWCRFQGYPDASAPTSSSGEAELSCHYIVIQSPSGGSIVQYLPSGEDDHYCTGSQSSPSYDTCSGSDPLTALNDILEINAFRHSISRPPLHISVGLASGVYTPEFYMLNENSGYTAPLSLPFNLPVGGGSTTPACGLEPQPWLSSFTSAYESAYSELLSFVHDTMTTGISPTSRQSRITLVKVTPMNSTSLELFLPGLSAEQSEALEDPGAPGHATETDDVHVNCYLTRLAPMSC